LQKPYIFEVAVPPPLVFYSGLICKNTGGDRFIQKPNIFKVSLPPPVIHKPSARVIRKNIAFH